MAVMTVISEKNNVLCSSILFKHNNKNIDEINFSFVKKLKANRCINQKDFFSFTIEEI